MHATEGRERKIGVMSSEWMSTNYNVWKMVINKTMMYDQARTISKGEKRKVDAHTLLHPLDKIKKKPTQ